VYAFGDVRSVYMRVCCARMSSDVLNDVEDVVFSIILCLNYAASSYRKTPRLAVQAAVLWVE
jgi:hypothetical protein